ncbi:MAG: gliding motility-associated C-terminal domain-containing protein [Bacteroidetes bacterium]|nr:gliding motility-associated C-terminal domain-containing protein [Bacteroidota bacterium]
MFGKSRNITFLLFVPVMLAAQVDLSHHVVDSWGSFYDNGSISVSSSVGETVVFTGNDPTTNLWFTQGFQQPDFTFSVLNLTVVADPVSCIGNSDGKISAMATGGGGLYTYNWSGGQIGTLVDNLAAGTYTVTVTDVSGNTASDVITLIEEQVKCGLVKIYKGFTPNADGHNDTWRITGIENFTSHVSIFNRWGDPVWEGSDYDNNTVVWNGDNKRGQLLPDGTYFYVVKYDNKTEKGWVELTR